jgi:hypothetical protein
LSVRPFVESDIPQVVDLYWNFMRERKGPSPPEVRSFFQELYFANPLIDLAYPSFVYEGGDGKIAGFMGVIGRKMSFCGQPIRAAFSGNFIIHPEFRGKIAATRLTGAYMAGAQHVSMTDSANDISRHIAERLGWTTLAPFSIHWVRPLRPAHCAVDAVSRLGSRAVSASIKLAAKPFSSVADGIASKLSFNPFRRIVPRLQAAELDVETLLHCLTEFRAGYSLWPEYNLESLQWLLSFMSRMPARGQLRKAVVRDNSQGIVGWYIYYVKPGGVGEVVQIGGDARFTKDVLDHLFHDAWNDGMIAVHGVANNRQMADLSDKNCIFTCRGGWTIAHSHNPQILELLNRGDAFLSHLDGEWCLDPGRSIS